ncbi:MAG: prepilin peptidase [Aureliella sp.]
MDEPAPIPQPEDLAPNAETIDESSVVEAYEPGAAESDQTQKSLWSKHPGWLLLGIGFAVYMVIVPTITMIIGWFTPVKSGVLNDMTVLEWIRLRTVSGVITFGFVCIGASVGSFLNVVIFRLPRKLPLLWPQSSCGNCRTELTRRENIPILGWLRIGGKCRYCGIPISVRYPIIESIVAFVFVLFFFRELLSGGVNLPLRSPNTYKGIVWILLYTKWDLISLYFFHMLFLCLLLAWGMMNHDRFRVPLYTVISTLILFVALASIFPHLNPTYRGWARGLSPIPPSVVASLSGCVAGGLLGWFLARLLPMKPVEPKPAIESESVIGPSVVAIETVAIETASEPTEHEPLSEDLTHEETEMNGSYPAGSDQAEPDAHNEAERPAAVDEANLYGSLATEPIQQVDLAASLALVGAAMGAESAVIVAIATGLLLAIAQLAEPIWKRRLVNYRPLPATVFVFLSTTIVLCFWKTLLSPITGGANPLL